MVPAISMDWSIVAMVPPDAAAISTWMPASPLLALNARSPLVAALA
ncbi:MAG: hypothetical protein JWO77_998 [Ilumatobacteraceae bacterium]|nr:hypothetical protein [Ilumatobacteraceae bacterium]